MANSDLALKLRITGDSAGLKKAMEESTVSIGKLEQRAESSAKAMTEALRRVEYFKRQAEVAGDGKAFAKDMAAAKTEVSAAEKALNKQNTALREARVRATELADAYEKATLAASKTSADKLMRAGLLAVGNVDANARARSTLGLGDNRAIASEIEAVKLAYERLRASGTLTTTELAQAKVKLRQRTAELAQSTNGWVGALGEARMALIATGAGAAGMVATGAAVLRVADGYTAMNAALRYATGSEQAAAREMEFLRETADRLGLPVLDAGAAFAKLAAASRGSALEGQGTREVFTGVASAARALGLSAPDMSGALLAVSQMMSKGVVSAEELRGQFGERIPGAFVLAAKAAGVTEAKFSKLLESGQVMAADFLPKFAAELNRAFGGPALEAAKSWAANSARLSNEFNEMKNAAGQAVAGGLLPLVHGLRAGFGAFNDLDGALKTYLTGMVAVAGGAGTAGGVWLALRNPLTLLAGHLKTATGAATLFNAVLLASPWVLVAAGIAALGYALYEHSQKETALTAARQKSFDALGTELARTQEYQGVVIKTGEEVDRLATKEVRGYADRLKGAAEYYHTLYAIAVKRKGVDDNPEADAAAAQRDVYVKAMAAVKPILAARLKLEKDNTSALKITQEELTPQIKAALDAQTKVYADAAKAVENAAQKRKDALTKQADFERQLLAGPAKKPEELTLSDFDSGSAAARQAAAAGDTETALKGVEALRAQLLAMKQAGSESDLVLSGLAKSVAEIENFALAKGEENAAAKKEKAFNDLLALQNMAKSLESIKIGVDQAAAEKALQSAQTALQSFADTHPIVQKVIVQAQDQMLLDTNYTAPKKAAGGLIAGPGSDTSDNLLAWLSPGEFVMRAAAVRQWGADKMAALNAGRMPAFAQGGMVLRALESLPRHADGGLVAAPGGRTAPPMQPITIVMPSGRASPAIQATPDSAAAFAAFVRAEALRVTG